MKRLTVGAACLFMLGSQWAIAKEADPLADISFEDLGQIVTSVSKKEEPAFAAPAAIYVLTQEDIKQSGLTSIAELLRMVPGLDVAHGDSESWAITSRGFNDGFGNKLLVLMDGRSVYTPLFSGVYWDVQDTFLDDIDRIEVIRGPGATLWGANAVNGVINIVTKKASETQSKVVNALVGKEEESIIEGRTGGKINDHTFYRVYGKRTNRDSSRTITGQDGGNNWYVNRSGFRVDSDVKDANSYTVQGDIYEGTENLMLNIPDGAQGLRDSLSLAGGNIIGKWEHKYSDATKSNLQVYADRTEFHYSLLQQDINTFDVDYQVTHQLNARNAMVMGAGYRLISDDLRDTTIISYDPNTETHHLFTGFVQDTYAIVPEKLNLTFGSKVEHNDFTGIEVQPSARLAWLPDHKQTVWASVSRAVRTPSRSDDDISLVVDSGYVRLLGSRELESEKLIAYEVGYRIKPRNNWSLDTTAFYNDYDDLRTNETAATTPADSVFAMQVDNKAKGESYGIELASDWDITNYWSVKAGYTFLTIDLHPKDGSTALTGEQDEGTSAKNKFNIRTAVYLPYDIELSGNMYYVDNITAHDIPSYIRLDTRIAWKPRPNLELSLVGFNMLDESHQEFAGPLHGTANEIERGYYAKASIKF